VLLGKQHNQEAAHRFALSALWNLAFSDESKKVRPYAPRVYHVLAATRCPPCHACRTPPKPKPHSTAASQRA
jgi:hypothetical protein